MRALTSLAPLAGAVALVALGPVSGASAAGATVPYHDSRVAGHLSLCDAAGRPVDHGLLAASPFAARVVTDFVPPNPYGGAGSSVFVLAYQPREGVDPGAWSGEQLTASSSYTDAAHPSAEVTTADVTLQQVARDFPPRWEGLLQLRVYSKAPGQPVYDARYAAVDLRVTGSTWQLVGAAALPCRTGTARSVIHVLAPGALVHPSTQQAKAAAPDTAPTVGTTPAPPSSTAPPTTQGTASAADGKSVDIGSSTHATSSQALAALAVGIVVLATAGGVVRTRRRSRLG